MINDLCWSPLNLFVHTASCFHSVSSPTVGGPHSLIISGTAFQHFCYDRLPLRSVAEVSRRSWTLLLLQLSLVFQTLSSHSSIRLRRVERCRVWVTIKSCGHNGCVQILLSGLCAHFHGSLLLAVGHRAGYMDCGYFLPGEGLRESRHPGAAPGGFLRSRPGLQLAVVQPQRVCKGASG